MVSWEFWGIMAMLAVFTAIGVIQQRRKFGEARFDSETGKQIEDE